MSSNLKLTGMLALTAMCLLAGSPSVRACDDACKDKRIRECCDYHVSKPKCLPLCRYNTTTREMIDAGFDCADQLEIWMYCAADGYKDNTKCCGEQTPPIKETCNVFCRGQAPQMCEKKAMKPYVPCAVRVTDINECHKKGVTAEVGWSKSKTFPTMPCLQSRTGR